MNINFRDYFNIEKLEEVYSRKLIYSTTKGINDINNNHFRNNRRRIFEKICKSIHEGVFKFDTYRVVLIPKDVDVAPRKICIPTMKDRIVLEILKEIIYDIYFDYDLNAKIGKNVEEFINAYKSSEYDEYIYADISKFYDNISHTKLINKIKKLTKDKYFLNLLKMSLKNTQKFKKKSSNRMGVPQGLSISNVLANIYMLDFDLEMKKKSNIKYLRYVDDIFVFYKKSKGSKILNIIKSKLSKLNLEINESKKRLGLLKNGESILFLGYEIKNDMITVRETTVKKLELGLEQIFKTYHYSFEKNKSRLEWIINLRITGALVDGKKYGWLYYFSRINDLKLLYHLDYLIEKFKNRYKINDIITKSFVKSYWEILSKGPLHSEYLLNINNFTREQKKEVLIKITRYKEEELKNFSDDKLNFIFKKNMFKSLKDLEMDLDGLS